MSLYTRFGDRVELVRLAAIGDVKKFENRRPDREDRERTADGWRAIARYCGGPSLTNQWRRDPNNNGCGDENVGKEILVDASYLKADNGWSEISSAFEALRRTVYARVRSAALDASIADASAAGVDVANDVGFARRVPGSAHYREPPNGRADVPTSKEIEAAIAEIGLRARVARERAKKAKVSP